MFVLRQVVVLRCMCYSVFAIPVVCRVGRKTLLLTNDDDDDDDDDDGDDGENDLTDRSMMTATSTTIIM